MKKIILLIFLISGANLAIAQSQNKKPQMQFLGAFDAGQAGVNIYKMFDQSDNVICYILMPEVAGRKPADGGGEKWIYDGNTIGSISCVKTTLHVSAGMQKDLNDIMNTQPSKRK